jgi:nicotinate phosphoribosyltransferase
LGREVRRIFDEAGLKEVKIIGSGGLDEYDLAELSASEAPFDSYGVGTKMGVSGDAPWFDMAYKLVQHNGRPVLKLSTGKVSLPGGKQVFRLVDDKGRLRKDILSLRDEEAPRSEPLLQKVMEKGTTIGSYPTLMEIRERFLDELNRLAEPIKAIRKPAVYAVELSPRLKALKAEIEEQLARTEIDLKAYPARALGES